MRNIKYIFVLIAMVLLASSSHARTLEIKMSTCPKPYVDNIRKMTASLRSADELILNFDKAGKYEFDGSLKFRCNTVIKGLGPNATQVIVKEGFTGGKSKMLDDTFFAVHGSSSRKVSAQVRDISFKLASHKGVLWEKAPKHIVKVCYGDGIVVDNIVTYSDNATLTHVDLRDCENVEVSNCEFENYNNSAEGGCLWTRGKQHNIHVFNNIFRKYGKDEVLGCWGGVNEKDFEIKNVVVEYNTFSLDNKTGIKHLDLQNFIAFNHSYTEGAKTYCNLEDIYFRNNEIKINAPIKRIMLFSLCKYTTVNNMEISFNEVLCTSKSSSDNSFMNDFDVIAQSRDNINITIKDNSIITHNEVKGNNGHTFLSVNNASVAVVNNNIENDYPQRLLWCHEGAMSLRLENNNVTNVYTFSLSSSKTIEDVSITATNNTLSGDTRIYCRNVKNLSLDYRNNVFNSSNYHFFLQEGAELTSITFKDNVVNALTGKGVIFANYDGKPCRFNNVTILNNTFNGLKSTNISEPFKKVAKLQIKGNRYK